MFEAFEKRVRRRAEALARRRAAAVADEITATLPSGVTAGEEENGVAVFGRGLSCRFTLTPSLRALAARLR